MGTRDDDAMKMRRSALSLANEPRYDPPMAPNPPLGVRLLGLVSRSSKPPSEMTDDEVIAARDRLNRLRASKAARVITGFPHRHVTIEQRALPLRDRTLSMRVYRPFRHQNPLPLVVHFHGGGFAFGTAAQTDWLNSGVAARTPALVVSVDYRLAPEHPFPASTQDAFDAVDWFRDGASDLNADPGPLALMGDSAGGNLAAVAAVHARDNDIDVALQVLIYPAVDFTDAMLTYPSAVENPDPILTQTSLTAFRRIWLRDNDPADPLISPLLTSDLRGVAPALVQTARFDPLRDQGGAYARRLRDAGALQALTEYTHAAHAFIALPGLNRGARQARREIVAHLQQAFARQLAESR
ncbi:alpha/beta hydrolase [Mycobacterium sp.]|uniref:alpha/beta hydrolase n=1 Tax=Mycobacterium sp. TaxID=1785 RepID=UPI003F97A419